MLDLTKQGEVFTDVHNIVHTGDIDIAIHKNVTA